MFYEFRHLHSRNVASVRLPLESDETALSFARLIENGTPVEVYADNRLVGRVDPNRDASDEVARRRIIAIPT